LHISNSPQYSRPKSVRSERITGPCRISDDLQRFIIYGEGELYPAMENLINKYGILATWGDTSVYYNREGEIIPEVRELMFAIKGYYLAKANRGPTSNSPYDIG